MADPTITSGMSSLLMQAAQSAAQADGLAPPTEVATKKSAMGPPAVLNGKKKGPPLRRGKWTAEEEAYANRLIQEFKAGLLPLTDGTTLRTFLSKLLNCDPMRISKKFVGNNCIGKQVFRRRNADLNRLTPEQIQQSRAELSELERRFLDRVAQTNRVKSSGVGGSGTAAANTTSGTSAAQQAASASNHNANLLQNLQNKQQLQRQQLYDNDGGYQNNGAGGDPPSPPWLQPPLGYKPGAGASFAAANLSGANSRAAAAGRALLGGSAGNNHNTSTNSFRDDLERKVSEAALLSMVQQQQLQNRTSQSNLLLQQQQNPFGSSASNLLAAAARSGSNSGLSNNALAQLAQSSSAARLAGFGSNPSMNDLMLKTGLSRDQLSQLARDRGMSSGSLSNMIQRQNSFDALMSLDFQSLQSIDNLANLMQNGGANAPSNLPQTGFKNADFGSASAPGASNEDLTSAARRLASAGRVESLLKNLSSGNVEAAANAPSGMTNSSANLSNLLQSIQGSNGNISAASLLGAANGQSAVSLANLLRQDSSTGLSALRMQDGLNQRNTSVDDFLSLVAAGDIPHQDPNLLNVPLVQQQGGGQGGNNNGSGNAVNQQQEAAARLLQQQQLLQASGNSALANALSSRSFTNLQQSLSNNNDDNGSNSFNASNSALAFAMAQSDGALKRKLEELGAAQQQGSAKR